MEYIKVGIFVVSTFAFFNVFVTLRNGLMDRPWIVVLCSALFAVLVAHLFNRFSIQE